MPANCGSQRVSQTVDVEAQSVAVHEAKRVAVCEAHSKRLSSSTLTLSPTTAEPGGSPTRAAQRDTLQRTQRFTHHRGAQRLAHTVAKRVALEQAEHIALQRTQRLPTVRWIPAATS